MKKFYYGDQNEVVDTNEYHNSDNERRKFLSLETNRRRRDMALRVKRQIEREEERRKQLLQERKEKQDALNSKIRMKKKNMDGQANEDLENILEGVRRTGRRGRQKESRMKVLDMRSENCVSPMARYSGQHSNSSSNTTNLCQNNMRTYETQVLEQEQHELRQYHQNEADLFTQTLEQVARPSVHENGDDNRTTGSTFRKDEFRIPKPTPRTRKVIVESLENDEDDEDDEDDVYDDDGNGSIEDSIEIQSKQPEIKPVPRELFKKPTMEPQKRENLNVPVVFCDDILKGYEEDGNDGNEADRKEEIHKIPSLKYCGIRGILKKNGNISKFDSNPDLSGRIDYLRDSLDLTKLRNNSINNNSTLYRSSSLTDNSININESGPEDESGRKYVRFADQLSTERQRVSDPVTRIATSSPASSQTSSQHCSSASQMRIQNAKYDSIHKLPAPKTIPNSTALKPPLHPRTVPSTQDGSYLQANFKRPPQPYQPPPRPKKINVDVLDRELSTLLVVNKRPSSQNETGQLLSSPSSTTTTIGSSTITPIGIPRRTPTGDHPLLYYNSLDKTPTEAEIDELWREVRECLSRTRNASRTGSVVNGPASIRTAESAGSDNNSIQSAPAQQHRIGVGRTPPFHVKHHITVKPTHFPGQEPILKDTVTIHNNAMVPLSNNNRHISQQPLAVVEDHRSGGPNQVSDSLEEFMAMEQASRMLSTPRQISNNARASPSPSRIFIHRPMSHTRPQLTPQLIHATNHPSEISNRSASSTQRTQLSIDEERVKLSLERLNEKLRNVASH